MRLTIVNTHDLIGGAERCSYDLARGLRAGGHDVRLVVGGKLGDDPFVQKLHYRFLDHKLRSFVFRGLGLTDTTLMAPLAAVLRDPAFRGADAVNLHNMHGSYWNFWTLPLLSRRRPVVLTLHDEWFLTGDCAYSYGCERWRDRCGRCPQAALESPIARYAVGGRDATRLNLTLKRWAAGAAREDRTVVVSPSEWLRERASSAPHLSRFRFVTIPYGIDLRRYRPHPARAARASAGLPPDVPLLLTVMVNLDDRRKNFAALAEVVRRNGLPDGARLVCAGRASEEVRREFEGLPVDFVGYVETREAMAQLLSACDVAITLPRADNLPYVAIEAAACGCPMIATRVGGLPEIVEHGVTGWLLEPDAAVEELASVIAVALRAARDPDRGLARRARERAERLFDVRLFTRRYERLFAELTADARRDRHA